MSLQNRWYQVSKCSFLMVLLLAFPVLQAAPAYGDVPLPYFDCEGNQVSPEEYEQITQYLAFLEGVYGQVFQTSFAGCDEGVLRLDWEPLATNVGTGAGSLDPLPYDPATLIQDIPGKRYFPDETYEQYHFVVIEYFEDRDQQVSPELQAVSWRGGSLFGWLSGSVGEVPIVAQVHTMQDPNQEAHTVILPESVLTAEDLSALALYRAGISGSLAVALESNAVPPSPPTQGMAGASDCADGNGPDWHAVGDDLELGPSAADRGAAAPSAAPTALDFVGHAWSRALFGATWSGGPILDSSSEAQWMCYNGPAIGRDCYENCVDQANRQLNTDLRKAENTYSGCKGAAIAAGAVATLICLGKGGWTSWVGWLGCAAFGVVTGIGIAIGCKAVYNANVNNAWADYFNRRDYCATLPPCPPLPG